MITRTQRTAIILNRPFALKDVGGLQPAGPYMVETEEELLDGLSFPAYRRVATTLTSQAPRAGVPVQAFSLEPQELAEIQAADGAAGGTAGKGWQG